MDGKQLANYVKSLYGGKEITPERLDYAISMLDPINYILKHHKVKGHPVTFDIPNYDASRSIGHRNWQIEPLQSLVDPNVQEVNIMKGRQLGFSEVGVMALIYFADVFSFDNVSILYTFPSIGRMRDHVKSRIRPEFEKSDYYRSLLNGDNNSLDQMSIRDSRIFFRSGSGSAQVEGVAINMAMMDEYERYAETPAEASIKESLKSDNRYGLIRRWSTPSASDFGIDARFKESDQRYWTIKCDHCGKWQVMNFEKNLKILDEDGIDRVANIVRPGSTAYVCQYCGKSLESSRWYNGEWVPKYTDSARSRGYLISQMNAVWLTSDKLYQDSLQTSPQFFYNYTLGYPYQDETIRVTKEDVLNNRRDYLPEPKDTRDGYAYVAAGIDWGTHYHHLVLLGMKGDGTWDFIKFVRIPTSTGTENIESDLHRMVSVLNTYEPDIIIPDLGYNGNYVNKLIKYFGKGKVYGAFVRSARSNGDPNAHFDENNSKVTLDKLMQNTLLITHIKMGRIGFYKHVDRELGLFIQHGKNVIIRDVEDDNGTTHKEISRKKEGD